MQYITGELLQILSTPKTKRYQFGEVMEYLHTDNPVDKRICVLYGLRRTGKTVAILQAIKQLLAEGVPADQIGLFTGERGDLFEDLELELKDKDMLKYIFIDEIGFFAYFLRYGAVLYDYFSVLKNKKIVIAGTNVLSLYISQKDTLLGRARIIRFQYLSFYEHCKFVLETTEPTPERLTMYMRNGGLFQQPDDVAAYVIGSISEPIADLFLNEHEHEIFAWVKPEDDKTDWTAYINTILHASAQYDDTDQFENKINRRIMKEFREYYGLAGNPRPQRIKRNEVTALLDFLEDAGVIYSLKNFSNQAEAYKCYVQVPFLRYSFVTKLGEMSSLEIVKDKTALMGVLLEGTLICEWHMAYPRSNIGFIRTQCDPADETLYEIDLIDFTKNQAIEVKLTSGSGYRGFDKIITHPLLDKIDCSIVNLNRGAQLIYDLGKTKYMG